jgi:hypothetical protein
MIDWQLNKDDAHEAREALDRIAAACAELEDAESDLNLVLSWEPLSGLLESDWRGSVATLRWDVNEAAGQPEGAL